jgi:hypothetical protein
MEISAMLMVMLMLDWTSFNFKSAEIQMFYYLLAGLLR